MIHPRLSIMSSRRARVGRQRRRLPGCRKSSNHWKTGPEKVPIIGTFFRPFLTPPVRPRAGSRAPKSIVESHRGMYYSGGMTAPSSSLSPCDGLLSALLQTAVDAIVTIDGQGRVLSFNPSAETMFGHDAATMVGRNVSVLMPSPHRERHDHYLARYLETGEARIIGTGRPLMGLRADGSSFPMELSVSEVKNQGQPVFVGIIRDVTNQRYLEQALVNAIENERREIGRDLHDALGQIVTGISLMAKSLNKKLSMRGDPLAADAATIASMCAEAMQETKRLAYGAFPTELERQGLKAALAQLLDTARRLQKVEAHFSASENCQPLPPPTELHLYRIAQESVANAIRHGRPANLWITLDQQPDAITLSVRDDGSGIPQQRDPDKISMGLEIMRHRASLIGGELSLHSPGGVGTEVRCCIPCPFLLTTVSLTH